MIATAQQYIVLKRLMPHQQVVVLFGRHCGKVLATANIKHLDRLHSGTVLNATASQNSSESFHHLAEVFCQTMLYGKEFELTCWLKKFLQFCAHILAFEQRCEETYNLLLDILNFPWDNYTLKINKIISKLFLLQLMHCNGFISIEKPILLVDILSKSKISTIDLLEQNKLDSQLTRYFLSPQQKNQLLEQVCISFGKENLTLFLQLLEGV